MLLFWVLWIQSANRTPGDPQPHGETGNKQDEWAGYRRAGSSQCSAQKNPSTEPGKGLERGVGRCREQICGCQGGKDGEERI